MGHRQRTDICPEKVLSVSQWQVSYQAITERCDDLPEVEAEYVHGGQGEELGTSQGPIA